MYYHISIKKLLLLLFYTAKRSVYYCYDAFVGELYISVSNVTIIFRHVFET